MSPFDLQTDAHRDPVEETETELEHLGIMVVSGLIPLTFAMLSALLYLYCGMP